MNKIFFVLVWVINIQVGSGQNARMHYVDSVCSSINEQITMMVVMPHTVSYIVNRPAIGIQKTTLDFYYNALSCENYDYDPLTDSVEYIVHPELYKLVMKYNVAASEFVSKEYYYENGKLIFFGSVIHTTYNNTGIDSVRAFYEDTIVSRVEKYINDALDEITISDKDLAEDAISYANEYLTFFKQMNALEYKQH